VWIVIDPIGTLAAIGSINIQEAAGDINVARHRSRARRERGVVRGCERLRIQCDSELMTTPWHRSIVMLGDIATARRAISHNYATTAKTNMCRRLRRFDRKKVILGLHPQTLPGALSVFLPRTGVRR